MCVARLHKRTNCKYITHYNEPYGCEIAVKQSKRVDLSIVSYLHQHVWLSMASLALSLAGLLCVEARRAQLEADYVKHASELHERCVLLVLHCLMYKPPNSDGIEAYWPALQSCIIKFYEIVYLLSEDDVTQSVTKAQMVEGFAVHSQERFIGLLGAMIPVPGHQVALQAISLKLVTALTLFLFCNLRRAPLRMTSAMCFCRRTSYHTCSKSHSEFSKDLFILHRPVRRLVCGGGHTLTKFGTKIYSIKISQVFYDFALFLATSGRARP